MRPYIDRVVDTELADRLRTSGAVLIEGARACGKTSTARRAAASVVRLDEDEGARALVSSAPETLFERPTPILFDEWQVAPAIWNKVRHEVDDRSPNRGLFILTGSSKPVDDITRHSGAGRFSRMRMRPMSLAEVGVASGEVSMSELFDGKFRAVLDPGVGVPRLIEHMVIGGWPELADAEVVDARSWLNGYLETIVEVDLPNMGARRAPDRLSRLVRSLGRSVGSQVSITSLAKDVRGPNGPADRSTVASYLEMLSRLMLTEDVPAWAPHMRSATPLRSSETRYFTDPSLGLAALGVGPEQLLRDLNAAGFHFEAMVVRDLRVYTQSLGGRLAQWRDQNGHEVDVVLTLNDGRWAAIEVKMNPAHADQAADSLKRFAAKVDTSRIGDPSFLAVLTTRSPAYRRRDGVLVLPVAALGP